VQGVLGSACFGEVIALQWWFGVCVILSGVALMSSANPEPRDTSDKKQQ
jgi:drug/metabolite transporter (DMT)-like permease